MFWRVEVFCSRDSVACQWKGMRVLAGPWILILVYFPAASGAWLYLCGLVVDFCCQSDICCLLWVALLMVLAKKFCYSQLFVHKLMSMLHVGEKVTIKLLLLGTQDGAKSAKQCILQGIYSQVKGCHIGFNWSSGFRRGKSYCKAWLIFMGPKR